MKKTKGTKQKTITLTRPAGTPSPFLSLEAVKTLEKAFLQFGGTQKGWDDRLALYAANLAPPLPTSITITVDTPTRRKPRKTK